MKCPYCNNEMKEGKIFGEGYLMRWMPNSEKLLFGTFVSSNHIKIGKRGLSKRPHVDAQYCSFCKKMIIDLK